MTLKEYRVSLGLTQEQAGDKLAISKARFGQLEKSWPFLAAVSLLKIVRAFDARIILEMSKGCRFLTPREIEAWDKVVSQDELNSDLDYLPDFES